MASLIFSRSFPATKKVLVTKVFKNQNEDDDVEKLSPGIPVAGSSEITVDICPIA